MHGDTSEISDETEVTQSFEVAPPAGQPPPPAPPTGPPRGPVADVWPWLAVLALLALAGLLVWFFAFRSDGGGARHRAVPQVVGLPERTAIGRLTGAGYRVRSVHEPARRPRGIVAAQAANGDLVTIRVANGRRPPAATPTTTRAATTTARTTTLAAPTVQLPDVTGQTMAAGAGQVEAAGLVADTAPVQGGGPVGSVVREDPAAGTGVQAGGTVTLSVAAPASPAATQVPSVVGRSAAEARAALLQAKLTVRTTYAKGKLGVVLQQSPTGTAPAYTQVTITVGR